MFFPKCPRCGGKAEQSELYDKTDMELQRAGSGLRYGSRIGHAHPVMQAMVFAIGTSRAIYKRVPGLGEKKCKICGHKFR